MVECILYSVSLRIVWVGSQIDFKIAEHFPEGLQVLQQFLLGSLLLQFWLSVSHQLLHVEHTCYSLLDLMLGGGTE